MSFYEELTEQNVIDPVRAKIMSGELKITPEGKLQFEAKILPNKPWITAHNDFNRKCSKWKLYFNAYQLIPRGCRSCWKVSFKPKTLNDLFKVFNFQKDDLRKAKCGTEHRAFTQNKGGYAAFWYIPLDAGLKGARIYFDNLEDDLQWLFQARVKLSLKRGCTEMEYYINPSDKWDSETALFNTVEDGLDEIYLDPELAIDTEPEIIKIDKLQQWIEYARDNGDMAYLDYTNGNQYLDMMTYNGSEHKEEDFRSQWNGTDNSEHRRTGGEATETEEANSDSDETEVEGSGGFRPIHIV